MMPSPGKNRLAALKGRLSGSGGWRRWALTGGLGVLAALALPPVYLVPLLIPAFVGLLWLVEGSPTLKRAFSDGWWFGFGHAAAGLSWIGFAFTVDAARYGWMAPFAVAGMAAGMALFPALAAALSRLAFTKRRPGAVGRVVVFAALWTFMEWTRGWVLTGFPWNLMGTVWVWSDAMIQLTAVSGVYGLSLLTVGVAAMPAVLAETDPGDDGGRRRAVVSVAAAVAFLGVVWGGGQMRLSGALDETVPGVRLRLVQPNIPQALKWKRELRQEHMRRQLEMSRRPPADGPPPTHVIWAETAVPYVLDGRPGLLEALATGAPASGMIITGALRADPAGPTGSPMGSPAGPKSSPSPRVWNSLMAIDAKGRIRGIYDKHHLVPFGEYVPLRGILPLTKLTAGRQDFSAGPGLKTLALDGLPAFSPLICYEIIFPGRVATTPRPQWILNITNDAWFGFSAGPYQHFAASRLRAVEEGLPVVRVANTGISGVVDGNGRVIRQLSLGQTGIIDSSLPVAVAGTTPFARLGDWMTVMILSVALGAGILLTPRD